MERLKYEKKDLIFETKPNLFLIDTITLLEEMISLLIVGILKIKSIEESNKKQGTLDQIAVKVVPSTMKSENFYVILKVSLEDKVYFETYYHHNQDDIQVDETLAKIQV